MDFAKKILNKYGWKEGDGLGKNKDGMSKPLKANLKFDNAGFGADQAASDFNNHWWERIFNEAASNVAIKSDKDGVRMNLKNPNETVEITTKGYSMRKLKKTKTAKNDEKYENFLQSATLTKSGDEVDKMNKITADEIEVQKFTQLTDDELFKACGGRTAHKGARHGLKLSGKLARLEMQEQEMLTKMLAKKNDIAEDTIKSKTKKGKTEKTEVNSTENKLKKTKRKNDEVLYLEENKSKKNKSKATKASDVEEKPSCEDRKADELCENTKYKKNKNQLTTLASQSPVESIKKNKKHKI